VRRTGIFFDKTLTTTRQNDIFTNISYTARRNWYGLRPKINRVKELPMSIGKAIGVAVSVLVMAGLAQAQAPDKPVIVEGLAGVAVPTFDITDLADPGFVAGAAAGYRFNDRVLGLIEVDFGTHPGADDGPDVNVYHYMAKAGYRVFQSQDDKWRIFVNAGLGAMTFDVDLEGAETNTYFAINAGAKVYYMINETIGIVVSPQGDIAFVDEKDGFTGSTAWVWPVTAGLAFSF
jgi:hypothetical protein